MARRAYEDFVESEAEGALRHETLLALTVRAGRGAMSDERRLRRDEDAGSGAELVRALSALHRCCVDGGLAVEGALSVDGLCRLCCGAPSRRAEASTALRPWPTACEELWSAFRTDGTMHATFWIAEWPRSDVGSDFLLPLLLASGDRRAALAGDGTGRPQQGRRAPPSTPARRHGRTLSCGDGTALPRVRAPVAEGRFGRAA